MTGFNLVDEPWLPCLRADGTAHEFGLHEAFVRAHEVRELTHSSPLVTVALHRLLLAVLHRALMGPATIGEWRALWQRGRWDEEVSGDYLGRWRHRFDLFDAERPFYQVSFMEDLADPKKQQPVGSLAQEAASGNNATLFDHRSDERPTGFSPAEAGRYLVARQAFSIGFGKSEPFYLSDSTLVRGYGVLAQGDTLFETLALNLVEYNAHRPIAWIDDDAAAWEQDEPAVPDRSGTPARGYVDYLTWQSRRIHLIAEGEPPVVRRCQLRQNLKPIDGLLDPFKCYVADRERGVRPRSFRPERALWRDSHILFQQAGESGRRPELFNWIARIDGERRRGAIAARPVYRFSALGMTTDDGNAASVVFWRHERLPLPLSYLDAPDLQVALGDALTLTEKVAGNVRQGMRTLARLLLAPESDKSGGRQPDAQKAVAPAVDHLAGEPRYWSRLEGPFRRFLVVLADDRRADEDGEWVYGGEALPTWAEEVRRAAMVAFEETARGLGTSARALKAVAQAEAEFGRRLRATIREFVAEQRSEAA